MSAVQPDTSSQPLVIPLEVRAFWFEELTHSVMLAASYLNLVPYGTKELGKLPSTVHELAVRKIADLVEQCARYDVQTQRRRRDVLRSRAYSEIWRTLRPFTRRGEFYVEHIIGDAQTRQEFEDRTAFVGPG